MEYRTINLENHISRMIFLLFRCFSFYPRSFVSLSTARDNPAQTTGEIPYEYCSNINDCRVTELFTDKPGRHACWKEDVCQWLNCKAL